MRSSEEKILKDGATLWWHCSSSVCFLPSCGSSRSWDLKKADCEKSWWHSSTSIGSGVVQQMSRSFYKKKRVFKLQDLVFGKWLGRWARYNLQRAYRSARGYLMFHKVLRILGSIKAGRGVAVEDVARDCQDNLARASVLDWGHYHLLLTAWKNEEMQSRSEGYGNS